MSSRPHLRVLQKAEGVGGAGAAAVLCPVSLVCLLSEEPPGRHSSVPATPWLHAPSCLLLRSSYLSPSLLTLVAHSACQEIGVASSKRCEDHLQWSLSVPREPIGHSHQECSLLAPHPLKRTNTDQVSTSVFSQG